MGMSDLFKKYRRKQVAELRPYVLGEVLSDRVSVSAPDREAGSPKPGDMIACNPKNHADQWLVAEAYFRDNFDPPPLKSQVPTGTPNSLWEGVLQPPSASAAGAACFTVEDSTAVTRLDVPSCAKRLPTGTDRKGMTWELRLLYSVQSESVSRGSLMSTRDDEMWRLEDEVERLKRRVRALEELVRELREKIDAKEVNHGLGSLPGATGLPGR